MSGPYVSFRVNRSSHAILTDTVRFVPDFDTGVFTNPLEWLIVCDSSDKVVIRALDEGARTTSVIAVAELRGMTLVARHQRDPMLPAPALWVWLEAVVYPTRERGYDNRRPDAFDPGTLAGAEPRLTAEQAWALAAPEHPQMPAEPAREPEAPPPPLWSSPRADQRAPGSVRYLELVFDHADVCVCAGAVRYTPDHALRPEGPYQQKLICDAQGNVTILGAGELDLAKLATARWKDSGLALRSQTGPEPDDFQWIALEDALRAELGRAP